MELIEKRLFRAHDDALTIPEQMRKLEEELMAQGYDIEPSGAPVVILKLDDGEVHYVPGDGGIWQYIFEYEGENE